MAPVALEVPLAHSPPFDTLDTRHAIKPLTTETPPVEDTTFEFDSMNDALAAFANGEFVVVVDDEGRENEGDLIVAASLCSTEKMAFMIKHTSYVRSHSKPDLYLRNTHQGVHLHIITTAAARSAANSDDGAQQHRTPQNRIHRHCRLQIWNIDRHFSSRPSLNSEETSI
jgi:hypothetical protein